MNCDDKVISKEDAKKYADLQEKESNLQLLDWVLKLMGTGMTLQMVRVRVHNKLIEIKGEGERA